MPRPKAKRDEQLPWMDAFIEKLEECGEVRPACKASGVPRATVYKYRQLNEAFEKRWEQAMSTSGERIRAERIEETLVDEALNGELIKNYEKRTCKDSKGKILLDETGNPKIKWVFTGNTRGKRNTTAAIFTLKGMMRKKYGDHLKVQAQERLKKRELYEAHVEAFVANVAKGDPARGIPGDSITKRMAAERLRFAYPDMMDVLYGQKGDEDADEEE